jgi:hypothetical protein
MTVIATQGFKGQHCETTATGSLLQQLDLHLSEPMLFGLGAGLSFIYWNMQTMDFPFLGGRIKAGELTQNICQHLNLELKINETSSTAKAWNTVKNLLDKGAIVGLKLDCYHLEYFSNPIHFAGHYAAIYGYDTTHAFLIDTQQQGTKVISSLGSLAAARSAKGPMSSKNLCYTITSTGHSLDLNTAIRKAIILNSHSYLHPPISNIAYKGIIKTAKALPTLFATSKDVKNQFHLTYILMEKAGTGGAMFRNLYRDFLDEAYKITGLTPIKQALLLFNDIACDWTEVGQLFTAISEEQNEKDVYTTSDLLMSISQKEKKAMEILTAITI